MKFYQILSNWSDDLSSAIIYRKLYFSVLCTVTLPKMTKNEILSTKLAHLDQKWKKRKYHSFIQL